MKNYILPILISFLSLTFAFSQDKETISIPLSNPGEPGTLSLYNHDGTIDIIGYSGTEVQVNIVSKGSKKKERPSRNGLKRIANRALGVSVTEENNKVNIKSSNNNRKDYVIKVPYEFSLNVSAHHNGDIYISNVKGYFEINSHHGEIEMDKINGAVIADTHHGEIKVSFTEVMSSEPMAFTTYHGDVDVAFPKALSADVKMKSAKGDIYTDFEFAASKPKVEESTKGSRKEIKVSGWTYGAIGSGGAEYRFDTYHGDVIIRQVD